MLKSRHRLSIRALLLLGAAMLLGSCDSGSRQAPPERGAGGDIVNAHNGIAMDGFDVVAYFTDKRPRKGKAQFSVEHKGKNWQFRSSENAEAFAQDPARFEPQYNGWCAYAVSEGYAAEVDFVNGWTLLEDKLYLNWDAETRDVFVEEQSKRKPDAEKNWEKVHTGLWDGSGDFYTHAGEGVDIAHPQSP